MRELMQDLGWYKNSRKQKKTLVKFGCSAALTVAFYWSWLFIPFFALTVYYYQQAKDNTIVEE